MMAVNSEKQKCQKLKLAAALVLSKRRHVLMKCSNKSSNQ